MGFQISWFERDGDPNERKSRSLLPGESLVIGREGVADIALKDDAVSRKHARLEAFEDRIVVTDLGSSNGTRLDGMTVSQTRWRPGTKLAIGNWRFELANEGSGLGAAGSSRTGASGSATRTIKWAPTVPGFDNERGQHSRGRLPVNDVFEAARCHDTRAIEELFSGFLGKNERIAGCGYLGSIGFIFPEHSFWCVTDCRVCGLLVNEAGWMNLNFGYLSALNRAVFVQPSILSLWIWLIAWCLFGLFVAIYMAGAILTVLGSYIVATLTFAAVGAGTVVLFPLVVRAYYRWVKAGCVFWTLEHVPIVIPADRNSLREAQRFISLFTDQRQLLD